MGAGILAFASLAATAVSAGLSIYGQNQQAKSASQAAAYNNKLAQQEADNLATESREAQKRQRMADRRRMAALRLQLAQQGTLNSSGTPLAIIGESQQNLSLRIADAARATDMQTAALRAKGRMGLWEAEQFGQAAKINMASTALGTATNAFGSYQGFKYTGAL